jgi:hypothetical protein
MPRSTDADNKKAERELKKLAKMAEQLHKMKDRNEKLKGVITAIKAKKAIRRSPGAPRVKRSNTAWVRALQQWNKGKDSYRIPKKGTPEYDQVVLVKNELIKQSGEGKTTDEIRKEMNDMYNLPVTDTELTLRDDEMDSPNQEPNIFVAE